MRRIVTIYDDAYLNANSNRKASETLDSFNTLFNHFNILSFLVSNIIYNIHFLTKRYIHTCVDVLIFFKLNIFVRVHETPLVERLIRYADVDGLYEKLS